jgi:hypothetical protein
VANPAAAPSDKTAAVMKNFVIVLPFPGPVFTGFLEQNHAGIAR